MLNKIINTVNTIYDKIINKKQKYKSFGTKRTNINIGNKIESNKNSIIIIIKYKRWISKKKIKIYTEIKILLVIKIIPYR